MPPAAGLGGICPPGTIAKSKNGTGAVPGPSKPDLKALREQAAANNDDESSDDEETTTDDSSDEEAALEMDGQELWTQTYCLTCDCLIEPGEGISKANAATAAGTSSPATHTTLKSRSGTIKARGSSNASDTNPPAVDETKATNGSKHSPTATKLAGSGDLKRTNSAGRLHAKAGAGPLGPHKRTGSAGSRLHALSELRPTTKLHDDKGKAKASTKSPAASRSNSRPGSAASNRSHSNSSGPSSFKSNDAAASSNANTTSDGQARVKKRGFLGGLGLTPAALKQQEAELAAKRKAPTPLYCSERCRLIDERRSSGLGELTQYLSQPLAPPVTAAWTGPPAPHWTRTASVSSIPMAATAETPGSDCLCPECMDKYVDSGSANGAAIPSGASDTATESSNGYMYARGTVQKPRTASGRLITPLGLENGGVEGYFPQYAPNYAMTPASQNSPRIRNLDMSQLANTGREPSEMDQNSQRTDDQDGLSMAVGSLKLAQSHADAAQKKASKRRSRDISVLPPLLAPISRSGSSNNLTGQPVLGRHSTMPVTSHRSPTPSVPEDGGEMSSQDLTSGDFVSRPNSAMGNGRRHHRTSLMPPPRSRSSVGMHPHRSDASLALTPASEDVVAEDGAQHPEPPRTWSYDHLSGLKTYPILQLPDRETHDVYDAAWGLDAGGLAKHLGQDARTPRMRQGSTDAGHEHRADEATDARNTQMGFQPHRKKLFYFDA
uniref:Uncharacterized protein n=1 Tax=Kalmanozyma brasiliensis (strain GHG001) TaxID=1365824 RepID=V5EX18_KALBG